MLDADGHGRTIVWLFFSGRIGSGREQHLIRYLTLLCLTESFQEVSEVMKAILEM